MVDLRLSNQELFELLEQTIYRHPEKHPLFQNLDLHEQIFTRKPNLKELFSFEPSPLSSRLEFNHDSRTGKLTDFHEVFNSLDQADSDEEALDELLTAHNSLSMKRMPSFDTSVKGNPTYFPFRPANLKSGSSVLSSYSTSSIAGGQGKQQQQQQQNTPPDRELIDFDNLILCPDHFEMGLISNAVEPKDRELFCFNERLNEELFEEIGKHSNRKLEDSRREAIERNLLSRELERMGPAVKSISIRDHKSALDSSNAAFVQLLDANAEVNDFERLVPNPARTYPFELDTFQKKAIVCLEQKRNILVAAHTSAGKTVIAEYAISLAFQNLTRVIYTSPIKALSNQKFRDFRQQYGVDNVGLLTGDIQIKRDAPCLIMTTEILLQMLYNGSELIRDLEWVIFDEVHYVNDKDRGHIWEEIFILLPDHISLVLLSATVSNITDFGGWLGKARNKTTYVIYTQRRPVPLEHFLYLGTDGRTDQYFRIIDKEGKFDNVEYRKAANLIKEREQKKTTGQLRNKQKSNAAGAKTKTLVPAKAAYTKNNYNATERNQYISLIRNLQSNKKLPLIVFVFSRQKCNESATTFWQCMDLCKAKEKARIHMFISHSLQKLKRTDRELPQVQEISLMLKNGFGVHHSGILPLLREITEILFQQGLVKVLFATETFAMGVNMPAKTVAFDSLEKHDGICKRELIPSEYIQMAGRAGRRGKDDTGTVIIICKENVPELGPLQRITTNKVCPIESKFRLTYSMILNILRARNHLRIESIMEKAFSEHKMQSQLDKWFKEKDEIEQQLKSSVSPDCAVCKVDLEQFSVEFHQYKLAREDIMVQVCCHVLSNKRILETGRLIVYEGASPFCIGVILKVRSSPSVMKTELRVIGFDLMQLVEFLGRGEKIESHIAFIELKQVDCILKLNVGGFIAAQVTDEQDNGERQLLCKLVYEKIIETGEEITSLSDIFKLPHLHPSYDLKMNEMDFFLHYQSFVANRTQLLSRQCVSCKHFIQHLGMTFKKVSMEARLENLYYLLSAENLQCLPEYQKRVEVLKELGYLNEELVLTMKGKVACLISEHELVITDLLVDNFLQNLQPAEIVAVMSCFMFQQKVNDVRIENELLCHKINEVIDVAKKVDAVQSKYDLYQNPTEIQDSLKFGLVDVVYQWGKGLPLLHLIKLTRVQEGIIVRCIQRIDELLKELMAAANLIGDVELAGKIAEASKCIRRDIVFSVSLYVQDTIAIKE